MKISSLLKVIAAVFGGALLCAQTPCFTAPNTVGVCPPPMVQIASVGGTLQINTKASAGSGTTITNAFPGVTTKGNSILCLGMESAAAVPVFTDAQSNTYVVITSSATAPGITAAVAQNIVGGSTDTITETTTSGAAYFACYEIQGVPPYGQIWDIANLQQGTGTSVPFVAATTIAPNEMVFTIEGFTTGQTVNATPTLGAPVTGLVTVDSANVAVTGGSALAVAYAAHTTLPNPTQFTQSVSLSASVVFSGVLVSLRPVASNTLTVVGTIPSYLTSTASTNATLIKASAGTVYSYTLINTTATLYYLRMYNLAAAPTCSSATGFVGSYPIPASATGAGVTFDLAAGEAYSTGIGYCLTGAGSSTDNTNAATGVYVWIRYK